MAPFSGRLFNSRAGGIGPAGPAGPPGPPGPTGTGANVISNSLKFSGSLVALATSATLYTVPANRYAVVTFSAGGPPQPQTNVLGFTYAWPLITGNLILAISNPSNATLEAFDTTVGSHAGPYKMTVQGLNAANAVTPNVNASGFLVTADISSGQTVTDLLNFINNYLTVNYGVAAGALSLSVPADGATIVSGGAVNFSEAATTSLNPPVQVNADPAGYEDMFPLIDLANVAPGKTASFTMSAGQALAVQNTSNTDSTSYDVAVVEFSN